MKNNTSIQDQLSVDMSIIRLKGASFCRRLTLKYDLTHRSVIDISHRQQDNSITVWGNFFTEVYHGDLPIDPWHPSHCPTQNAHRPGV